MKILLVVLLAVAATTVGKTVAPGDEAILAEDAFAIICVQAGQLHQAQIHQANDMLAEPSAPPTSSCRARGTTRCSTNRRQLLTKS
jgi:hypothetical protein